MNRKPLVHIGSEIRICRPARSELNDSKELSASIVCAIQAHESNVVIGEGIAIGKVSPIALG